MLRGIPDVDQDSDGHLPLETNDSLQSAENVLADIATPGGLDRLHEGEERGKVEREVEGADAVKLITVISVADEAQADL